MKVDIDAQELATLRLSVDTKLAIAMNELVHTDARDYRAYLRDLVTSLEALQKKLKAVS
jgi:hypothetical protein